MSARNSSLRSFREHPDFNQLRRQAKDLLAAYRAGDPEAVAEVSHHYRGASPATFALHDAQLVLARAHGLESWPKLKQHVELLTRVDRRVQELRAKFASGDREAKLRLLAPAHTKVRLENGDPDAASLSEGDARLLVANEEGYAFWSKYDSFLHLDPTVQAVIGAVRSGDLRKLRDILHAEPSAANPKWVSGYTPTQNPIPNDSIPLFCVSEAIFRKTNRERNDYELASELIAAGAEVDALGGLPLVGAVSFSAIGAARALLEGGAAVDGVDGDGVPMAYAIHFGFRDVAELLVARGAHIDLRFAAGLGRLDVVNGWFNSDGSLRPGAGGLADPYGFERKLKGQSPFRCERTEPNILSQAFYFACVNGTLDVADFLLAHNVDINAIVPGLDVKATVLHRIATMDQRAEHVVSFLLARGADPSIHDLEYDATPEDWARFHKRDTIAKLLSDAGRRPRS